MTSQLKPTPSGTGSNYARAGNDAFGKNSPHWNLSFPHGRLTAAEILTYCPHWLKSVDVIDRFVSNGAKAKILAGMLGRFRVFPSVNINSNSVCVMMQCAMRAAGFQNWKMSTHGEASNIRAAQWDCGNLDVSNFRASHITHPKGGSKQGENVAAAPIQFRDLARDVKEHPSGYDALDLTRCVIYAKNNPRESWLFPDDFHALVNKLGGPKPLYGSHLDTRAFQRAVVDLFSPAEQRKLTVTPITNPLQLHQTATLVSARPSDLLLPTGPQLSRAPKAVTASKKCGFEKVVAANMNTSNAGHARRSGRIATQDIKNLREPDTDSDTQNITPYYKDPETDTDDFGPQSKKRRSTRARSTDSDFVGNNSTDSDSVHDAHPYIDDGILSQEPVSKRPVRASAQKSRILTKKAIRKEMPRTRPGRGPQSFTQIAVDSNPAYAPVYLPAHTPGYLPTYDQGYLPVYDQGYLSAHAPNCPSAHAPNYPSAHAPNYPSAHAPNYPFAHTLNDMSAQPPNNPPAQEPGVIPTELIDPELLHCAASWVASRPAPILAPAPALSRDRLKIDEKSIFLYAEAGCTSREEMWASALSSTRFGGPRTSAPYRELYRLTAPEPWDLSDWAESIRWAKEQHRAFGVKTWTEYDYHLEQMTQIRRETMWVSQEAGNGVGPY